MDNTIKIHSQTAREALAAALNFEYLGKMQCALPESDYTFMK